MHTKKQAHNQKITIVLLQLPRKKITSKKFVEPPQATRVRIKTLLIVSSYHCHAGKTEQKGWTEGTILTDHKYTVLGRQVLRRARSVTLGLTLGPDTNHSLGRYRRWFGML